ncbi:MAG: hypothetical protein AAGD14_17735 [Planctomycetota bacterium]
MSAWPSLVRRKNDPRETAILWDVSVFFFVLGIPVLLVLAFLDDTVVNAEPRWLKPLKFFFSIALYNLTLEWLYRVFRTDRNVAWLNRCRRVIAVGMGIEGVLIVAQAARGVQSHFNVATSLDAAIFSIMGVTITIVVLTALASGWLIWRARDRAPAGFGEAALLGIVIMTAASFQGFAMTEGTARQEAEQSPIQGSHFVGDPPVEGHRTLPVTGWSLDVGDLRIAHFIGLHALQLFLLLAFLLDRFAVPARFAIIRLCALGYGGLFLFAFLRAQSGAFLL